MATVATTYAPAVLLIEDDGKIREYYRDKFYEETSLGVILAKDLKEARVLIESRSIQVDAVVADLFFDFGKDYPEAGLRDGLDILKLVSEVHPEALKYISSMWVERREYLQRAKVLALPIKNWFMKQFIKAGDRDTPWAHVERDLLQYRLLKDPDLPKVIGLPKDLATATEMYRTTIWPIRRTYLQDLGESELQLLQPIEVLTFHSAEGVHHASADKLGLLTEGTGETLIEALDMLKAIVVKHHVFLQEHPDDTEDYSGFVKARLREYISERWITVSSAS